MGQIVIRCAKANDAERALEIKKLALKGQPDEIGRSLEWKQLLEKGTVLVAEIGGDVVGYAAIDLSDKDEAELTDLYVHPNFQGRGIGGALLGDIEQTARKAGCKVITLDAIPGQSQEFYKNHGYTVRSHPNPYGPCMRKQF